MVFMEFSANFASSKGTVATEWFKGGKTNIAYNALDRHVAAGAGDQIALYHEANDEDDDIKSEWTYSEVLAEVIRSGSSASAGAETVDALGTRHARPAARAPLSRIKCFCGFTYDVRRQCSWEWLVPDLEQLT